MSLNNDPRLSGYLTRALSHELAAVQQYLMQAKLAGLWGMPELSARLHQDAGEELGHVGQIMQRMLVMGVPAPAIQLPPARPGRNVEEMLHIDRALEIEVIRLYEDAARYCARMRDSETQTMFDSLRQDELGHLHELDRQLQEIQQGTAP